MDTTVSELLDFYERCNIHTWYYENAPSYEEWKRGSNNHASLKLEAEQDPNKAKILDSFQEYMFSNGVFPERPVL